MGLFNSFQLGVSGLSAHSKKISSISDNIANSSTAGFKANEVEFEEALNQSLHSSFVPGGELSGVRQAKESQQMTQGELARSESSTDMAIKGEGFFELETKFGKAYTRNGSFQFNNQGELVNGDGHKVLGYTVSKEGVVTKNKAPIKIDLTERGGNPSNTIAMTLNLDARSDIKEFNPEDPYASSNFQRQIKVFNNEGKEKYVTVFFTKTAENQWSYNAMVEGPDAPGDLREGNFVAGASGTISFENGALASVTPGATSVNFKEGGSQELNFDFGQDSEDQNRKSSQYGTKNSVSFQRVNGNGPATVQSIGFGPNGTLQTYFSDGSVKDQAQVALANFTNKEGLKRIGSNLFSMSSQSGQAMLGTPGEEGLGEIESGAIELSNVDISHEFLELLSSQQAFNASSKTVSTADELLQKIINVRS